MSLFKQNNFSKIKSINKVVEYYLSRVEIKNKNPFVKNYCIASLIGAQFVLEESFTNDTGFNQIIKYKNQTTEETVKTIFKIIFIFYLLSFTKARSESFKNDLFAEIKNVFNFNEDDASNTNFIKIIFPTDEKENKLFALSYYILVLEQFSKTEQVNPASALFFRGLLSASLISLLEHLKDNITN